MRVLVVEDDLRVSDFVQRGLKAARHAVTIAESGEVGLALATSQTFDVVVLDLMLPVMPGLEVCQTLRQRGIFTPVLILSALDTVKDRVEGLRLGADDYLVKPFDFEELVARIEALGRRGASFSLQPPRIQVAGLEFDRETLNVRRDGSAIKLTARELAVLELLLTPPGKVYSRESILSNIWGTNEDPFTNIVDVYIGRLRKRLDVESRPSFIETVRGIGYRFNVPEGLPHKTV